MFVILLTGGLGAGKSFASSFFRSRGATVIDLDVVARGLLRSGTETHERVVEEFGEGILGEGGEIDHARLAEAAFASPESASRLNAAVHPQVAREVLPGLLDLQLLPSPPEVVVLEVPLLAEAPAFAECADTVLAIGAPEAARVARAVASGMDERDARARIACQAADAARAALADRVILNDSTLEDFERELDQFWAEVVAGGDT